MKKERLRTRGMPKGYRFADPGDITCEECAQAQYDCGGTPHCTITKAHRFAWPNATCDLALRREE